MTPIAALVIAGTIVTSQGAQWVPVTAQTMTRPVHDYNTQSYGFPRYDKKTKIEIEQKKPELIPIINQFDFSLPGRI